MNSLKKYSELKSGEVHHEKIKISYKFVDYTNDYFFLHGLSKEYYKHLTDTLEMLQNISENELRQQKPITNSLNPKSINFSGKNTISQESFPIKEGSPIFTYIKNKTLYEDKSKEQDIIQANLKEFIKNSFEISLSKRYGRIHGFIYQNIFYIIWFDPAHNLFLTKNMGKQTKLQLPEEIQKLKPICPTKYQEYNNKLQEVSEYVEMLIEEQ